MNNKIKNGNDSYSLITFIILIIPSILFTLNLLSKFNYVGVPFILLFILGSLGFSTLGSSIVSIYRKGKLLWKGLDDIPVTGVNIFDILIIIITFLLYFGSKIVSNATLKKSQNNFVLSCFWALIISTVSTIPFIVVIWIVLQFYN